MHGFIEAGFYRSLGSSIAMNVTLIKPIGPVLILAFAIGCDRVEPGPTPTGAGPGPDSVAAVGPRPRNGSSVFDDPPPRPTPMYSKEVAPIIEQYCLNCHDGAAAEGGIVLDGFRDEVPDKKRRPLLLRVADVLRSEAMPPEGEPRVEPEARETLDAWLDAALGPDDQARGRVTLRRLNRAEYNNTIRDLIGADWHPADEFPADDIGYGFDNIGDVLATPPILVEMYLASAETAIAAAFRSPELWARIMDPPANAVPLAFRKYKPPVRTPREDKVFRIANAAPDPDLIRQQRIYDILRGFADRAFRRPATHDELTRLLGIVLSAESDGESEESAIQRGLQTVLVSPHFLFRVELEHEGDTPSAHLPENDFDLASRLSYFLWSSMPDEELFRLAAQASLRRRENLQAQVGRMLRDPRSHALAENFGGQWLQTRKLREFVPDPVLFPNFDELLKSAMLEETRLFCVSIQDEDRSVLEFLDADYSFVNERLARHYGIPGIQGESFRRVTFAGTARGGVLTQASILTATSNPTRTSPVKRGKWILENILGTPPSPPPSGVEALKEGAGSGSSGTLRERMERHRTDPACASCHRRMDPLGFGLENFDAIGGWRAHDGTQPIDPSGKLPGGSEFRGPIELRAALLSHRDAFARCLAEKMLTYALGRGLDRADRRAVDRIVASLARNEYRYSALVMAIVESEPFRSPHTTGDKP
jgi:hypothetical protein